jgi:flagellar FliL protein
MGTEQNSVAAMPNSAAATRLVAKQRSSAPRIFGLVCLAILGAGGSAWFILQRGHQAEAAVAGAAPSAPKFLLHLEGFTVNLADPEETHFLRVTIDLGVDHLPAGSSEEKSTANIPVGRVRDSILSALTSCKADALLTAEGKSQLKRNLVDVLQKQVPELGVREIYFTEFLVQR